MTYSVGSGTAGEPLAQPSLALSSACSVLPFNYALMQPTQTISLAKTFTWSATSITFFVVGHYNFICRWASQVGGDHLLAVEQGVGEREGRRKKYLQPSLRNAISHCWKWCNIFLHLPLTMVLNGGIFFLSLWNFLLLLLNFYSDFSG